MSAWPGRSRDVGQGMSALPQPRRPSPATSGGLQHEPRTHARAVSCCSYQANTRANTRSHAGDRADVGSLLATGVGACLRPTAGRTGGSKSRGAAPARLVTQAEMSALLGGAVIAAGKERGRDQTECIYSAASGTSPYAELRFDRGILPAVKMRARNALDPGLVDRLRGFGDQAMPWGMLSSPHGEDLVTIVVAGVATRQPRPIRFSRRRRRDFEMRSWPQVAPGRHSGERTGGVPC